MRSYSPLATHSISSWMRRTGIGWVTLRSSSSPREPLEALAALAVLLRLLHEDVEVEALGLAAGGEHHQHAADRRAGRASPAPRRGRS